MKKIISIILMVSILLSMGIMPAFATEVSEAQPVVNTLKYSDVTQEHPYYDAIERATIMQWFNGYPDGTFCPDKVVTRAEAMKVFAQFIGLPVNRVEKSTYTDVAPDAWYAPYVEATVGIFPLETDYFSPNKVLTKEEAVYILVNALGYSSQFGDTAVLSFYMDGHYISAKMRNNVAIAVSNGMVDLFSQKFGPQNPVTRGELANYLYKAPAPDWDNIPQVETKVVESEAVENTQADAE